MIIPGWLALVVWMGAQTHSFLDQWVFAQQLRRFFGRLIQPKIQYWVSQVWHCCLDWY
jgi:hypothetical protein